MPSRTSWIVLSLLQLVTGFKFPDANRLTSRAPIGDGGIAWTPCFNNVNLECGRFETPLDYANPSVGNASLAVIRYRAVSTPRLGTLWVNPGGPGGSGVDAIAAGDGELISNITGGYFDVASWDPRGVNNTFPLVQCFDSQLQERFFWNRTLAYTGIEVKGNFTEPADLSAFYGQVDQVDSLLGKLGETCSAASSNTLAYVGTAAAVRDMVALTDALDGPQALVNYWGFSYGTVIGMYFVNMFPERVGRVVIDGVVNGELWANVGAYKGWADAIADTDKVLNAFCESCAQAGPTRCAIAFPVNGAAATTASVHAFVVALLNDAYDTWKVGGPVSSAEVRYELQSAMYAPRAWSYLAHWLLNKSEDIDVFLQRRPVSARSLRKRSTGDIEAAIKAILHPTSGAISGTDARRWRKGPEDSATDYAFHAITCADSPDADYTTRDVFDELVRVTQQVSTIFGPQWGDATQYCHRWPARATERFKGPWNSKLRTPIISIGNEADPITPLHDAKWAADQLGDSAFLIEQEGYGHTSLAMHSDCTIDTLARYFIAGELPTADKTCAVNQILFADDQEAAHDISPIRNITAVEEGNATASTSPTTTNKTTGSDAVVSSRTSALLVVLPLLAGFVTLP